MKRNVRSSVFPSQKSLVILTRYLLTIKVLYRVVKSVKLLGLSFDNNLTWNLHIEEVVKKVSKRIYYLIQLKRASIPRNDLVLFYVTCIRSVIDYGIPVIYYSLPKYLCSELKRLQKRAIIQSSVQTLIMKTL